MRNICITVAAKLLALAGRVVTAFALLAAVTATAATGQWQSAVTGGAIKYTTSSASTTAAKDADGKPMTVVYLENLGFQKIGRNSNAEDVSWLRSQGYQVVELDYGHSEAAVAPRLNQDIIAINSSLQSGRFCGVTCSSARSYILMEGYRLCRDIAYYRDDPAVYNYPDAYKATQGDSLYLDLVYPANPAVSVPVVVTFSYSNSYSGNKHRRMYLPYTWGAFRDSFVEGASAVGFAWAVCDHPKYCDWGQGKYTGGANKSLGAVEVNPDAARKVKSAIRTVRAVGRGMGLNGDVAVTGFSRGSTAAALAVGDGWIAEFEEAARGRFAEENSRVQCAVLGPGMFDYEHALSSSTEYTRLSTFVAAHPALPWTWQGALATIESSASAPTLFFHNADDYYADKNKDSRGLYATQAQLMKAKLDERGVATEVLTGYGSGHAVPQDEADLQRMYDFLCRHVATPTGIVSVTSQPAAARPAATYDLMGRRVGAGYRGLVIKDGRLYLKSY